MTINFVNLLHFRVCYSQNTVSLANNTVTLAAIQELWQNSIRSDTHTHTDQRRWHYQQSEIYIQTNFLLIRVISTVPPLVESSAAKPEGHGIKITIHISLEVRVYLFNRKGSYSILSRASVESIRNKFPHIPFFWKKMYDFWDIFKILTGFWTKNGQNWGALGVFLPVGPSL